MRVRLVVLSVALLSSFGCASIIKGSNQLVSINSNVKDAEVKVDGVTVGKTPFTGQISRGSSTTVTLSKQGYDSKTITMNTEVEPVFWGNIILGGVFGSTTDLSTGAMYKYAPATVEVDLQKSEGN